MLVLLAAMAGTAPAAAETLGDVLRARGLTPRPRELPDLRQAITSYAVLDDDRALVIAYYRADGSDALRGPLVVRRLDRTSFQWRSAELPRAALRAGGVDCLGSATRVQWAGRNLAIETHLTPSAGCTIVVEPDLGIVKVLYGRFLAAFADGSVVYQRSQPHFAPTQSLRVAVWEPRRARDRSLYPAKPDQRLRREHVAQVAVKYADEEWCRARNHHCDPERFDEHLVDDAVVDDATSALAFVVALDRTTWWSDAERARLDAFRELRKAVDAGTDGAPTDAVFRALDADLRRAERHPGRDATLAALQSDADLRELVAAVLAAPRPAEQGPREFLLGVSPRWGEASTWQRLARAIEVPARATEVAYVYRNVANGGVLEVRELSREDLRARCGELPLGRCLEPASLARIFRR